jgi:hypothetical protein
MGQRLVEFLIPMTTDETFSVSLATAPDSSNTLLINGRGIYSAFSLTCALPPRNGMVMIDLEPSARGKVTHQARLLYVACRKIMPNAVELGDFR